MGVATAVIASSYNFVLVSIMISQSASEYAGELAGDMCLGVVTQGASQPVALLGGPVFPAGAGEGIASFKFRSAFALQTGWQRHRSLLVAAAPSRVLEMHLHELEGGGFGRVSERLFRFRCRIRGRRWLGLGGEVARVGLGVVIVIQGANSVQADRPMRRVT